MSVEDQKQCRVCHVVLQRRRHVSGELENGSHFAARTVCGECSWRGGALRRRPSRRLDTVLGDPRRACRNVDPNVLFSGENDRRAVERLRPVALRLCAVCPVLEACRAVGEEGREWGLWGGVLWAGKAEGRDLLAGSR